MGGKTVKMMRHDFADKTAGHVNCSVDNGGCDHNCTDLKGGGYLCSCKPGFQISSNKKTCEGMCIGLQTELAGSRLVRGWWLQVEIRHHINIK